MSKVIVEKFVSYELVACVATSIIDPDNAAPGQITALHLAKASDGGSYYSTIDGLPERVRENVIWTLYGRRSNGMVVAIVDRAHRGHALDIYGFITGNVASSDRNDFVSVLPA